MNGTEAYDIATQLYGRGLRANDMDAIRDKCGFSDYETLLVYYALLGMRNIKKVE
jgi:hypothetical protein|nr:MAG TPA: Protein of unknown function (DUF2802) [Caudoviricetes sp.]